MGADLMSHEPSSKSDEASWLSVHHFLNLSHQATGEPHSAARRIANSHNRERMRIR